jgi:bacteriocin-like protein
MASIKISELRPSDFDFFGDSESFLDDLSDKDLATINGGRNDIEITITVIVIVYIEIR